MTFAISKANISHSFLLCRRLIKKLLSFHCQPSLRPVALTRDSSIYPFIIPMVGNIAAKWTDDFSLILDCTKEERRMDELFDALIPFFSTCRYLWASVIFSKRLITLRIATMNGCHGCSVLLSITKLCPFIACFLPNFLLFIRVELNQVNKIFLVYAKRRQTVENIATQPQRTMKCSFLLFKFSVYPRLCSTVAVLFLHPAVRFLVACYYRTTTKDEWIMEIQGNIIEGRSFTNKRPRHTTNEMARVTLRSLNEWMGCNCVQYLIS